MRPSLFGGVLVLLLPAALASQAPFGVGTAAGLGGTAVTSARRADAVQWNPALVGVHDGPERTTSLLALEAPQLPSSDAADAAAWLGLLSGRVQESRFTFLRRSFIWTGGAPDAALRVRWAAVQSRDLAVTVETRYATRVAVPPGLASALGVESADPAGESYRGARSLVSLVTAAKGAYLGQVPVLGRMWFGVSAKGAWVHTAAEGAFRGDLPAEVAYDETMLGNAGILGVDAGVAGLAGDRLWYGLSVSNVHGVSSRPRRAPRSREVRIQSDVVGGLSVDQSIGPEIRHDDPDSEAVSRAAALWDATRYPAVLRGGVAVDSRYGRFAGSWREVLRPGGLDVLDGEAARTLAWSEPSRRLRVAYGWGEGREIAAAAVSAGRCDRRWTVGIQRSNDGMLGVAIDLSLASDSCTFHPGTM